jgi:hypothetical protein
MTTIRLPLAVCFLALQLSACAGEEPPAQSPPPPATSANAEPTPAAPATTEKAATEPAPAAAAPEPPPKPAKEKIVGKWQFSFEGDPKSKAQADAEKKFPKEKDQAKRDAFMQKIADEAAGEWIEFADGYYVSHVTVKGKDKVVFKVKYDVAGDDNTKLTLKPSGKDEISKKAAKDELAIAFNDDLTITVNDPKKKMALVFKKK